MITGAASTSGAAIYTVDGISQFLTNRSARHVPKNGTGPEPSVRASGPCAAPSAIPLNTEKGAGRRPRRERPLDEPLHVP